MNAQLSARDASILTLIAETPDISPTQFDKLLALASSDDVREAARALRDHTWDQHRQDISEFARAIYESTEERRSRNQEPVTAAVR